MRKLPIFYSALLLTGVNLVLRLVGTGFQVYLSGVIGAAGVGLLQLVLSVGSLALVAGIGGIRTTTMYLTAEDLGRKGPKNLHKTLVGCTIYSLICSCTAAAVLFIFSPALAIHWIGVEESLGALRLLAAFLPVSCLCGVFTGYYTAAGRIGTLAAVEVAEQLFSMAVTWTALELYAGGDPGRACQAVVLGTGCGNLLTLLCLMYLLQLKPSRENTEKLAPRILRTAVPLALADDLKTGISTAENLMVPKRLALYTTGALAAFGTVCGMVFPVLMFPAAVLFSLAELLIPELARCAAAERPGRIHHLVRKSLGIGLMYGLVCGCVMILLGQELGLWLYNSQDAGIWLKRYALLAPMLYCDAIVDAMNKGLGQQVYSVRYNILTSGLDILFLYILLPVYGMQGYFWSFLVTHVINFVLSLRRLLLASGVKNQPYRAKFALVSALTGLLFALQTGPKLGQIVVFFITFGCLAHLFGVLKMADWRWLKALIRPRKANTAP